LKVEGSELSTFNLQLSTIKRQKNRALRLYGGKQNGWGTPGCLIFGAKGKVSISGENFKGKWGGVKEGIYGALCPA
jgi:hypothetical protein